MPEDIRIPDGVHVAFDCTVCGARHTGKNSSKATCPRCGLKFTIRAKVELVIESGPTKTMGKDGIYR